MTRLHPARVAGIVGGVFACAVSVGLLAMVLARDVGLNPLNAWTILLGLAGGVGAVARRGRGAQLACAAVIALAALPALPGGLGYLYAPAILVLVLGALMWPEA